MQGILLVDKPLGWTSFDVVNKVRRIIQNSELNTTHKKRFPVGHTGTLDPQATGLLVLLLGKSTKLAPQLTKLDKTYEVTMRLGEVSSTGDAEGEKRQISANQPSLETVRQALAQFEGPSQQTPPAFSAIKVNGQRAYKLARAGKAVELKPRPITIHQINLTAYTYPEVRFTAAVSSGTYIRSLVEDLGQVMHTGAYLAALRRTTVGRFNLADALPVDHLTPEMIAQKALSEFGID